SLPGVRGAGVVSYLPLSRTGGGRNYEVAGRAPPAPGERPFAQYRRITPGYPDALGIPVLRGRALTASDDADSPPVALIDRTLARRHWPEGDPVGERLEIAGERREIVGVVGDVHHWGPAEPHRPTIYVAQAQDPSVLSFLAVRTASDPAGLAAPIRREIGGIDPQVAVAEVKAMDRVVAEFHAAERLMAGMLGAFAAIALLISAVGIYGVIAYSVSRRTHEIGVRLALGAEPRRVLRMVVGQGLALTAIGLGIGLAAAVALTRFMAGLLYGVSATDPATVAGVALLLAAVALLAAYLPARAATRVDPVLTLREE
ncbi:MAG: FtsX-like permease family protein, partial [Gemmatimonadota bacterium]